MQYNENATNTQNTDEPSNMYSSSPLRAKLISPSGVMGAFASGDFAQNYLVQPNHIAYQHTESNAVQGIESYVHSNPNDALDQVGSPYDASFDYSSKPRYQEWGNDYIWLPSLTETGTENSESKSLWGLNTNQLANGGKNAYWLRSGGFKNYDCSYTLNVGGVLAEMPTSNIYGVRPAIHLNLAAAARSKAVNNAYKIGANGDGTVLTDVWDGSAFNKTYMDELAEKLTGKSGAGIGDVKAYVNAHGADEFGGKVVKAPAIRTNSGNADYGIVLRLNGFDWIVASLTLDTGGNVAATLYLADDYRDAIAFHTVGEDLDKPAPDNMYSTSAIRQTLTSASGAFAAFASGTFAENFFIQPNNVLYQQSENNSVKGINTNYASPNDALGKVVGYYSEAHNYETKARYAEWGGDYIWIPSLVETGATGSENLSIWGLNANQLSHGGQARSWLRSANHAYYGNAFGILADGSFGHANVSAAHGLRPAVHLNLSAVLGEELGGPGDVSTVYDGARQTLPGLATAPGWFDAERYGDPDKIVVTYPSGGVENAGTYWVKVEIAAAWLESAQSTGGTVKFSGTPDTSDAAHLESDTVRWFRWTVSPKEITVNAPAYDAATGVFTPPSLGNPDEFVSAARPTLAVRYTGGNGYDKINEIPTLVGTYKAQAVFVNSEGDLTLYGGNYVVKNAERCFATIVVKRTRLAVPTVTENSRSYTGAAVTFSLAGYGSALSALIDFTLPAGLSLTGNDTDGWFLSAVDAGVYNVTANLKDDGQYCWDKTAGEEIVAAQSFSVTVRRKELTVTFTSSTGAFFLETGAAVTFTASESSLARDTVVLTLSYYNKTNPGALVPIAGSSFDASGFAPGEYALVAVLEDAKAAGNKNYYVNADNGRAEKDFTVSAKSAAIGAVQWQWSQNNGAKTDVAAGAGTVANPLSLTYNGARYRFEVATGGFSALGVRLDVGAAAVAAGFAGGYKNAEAYQNATNGTVTVTVRLCPADGWAFNDENGHAKPNQFVEFTLTLAIGKAKYDLSGVRWGDDAPEFTGQTLSIGLENLPAGLTVEAGDFTGNTGLNAGGYTATLLRFRNADPDNYITPVKDDAATYTGSFLWAKTWNIAKKIIALTWTTKPSTDKNGIGYGLPILSGDPAQIVYSYQTADSAFRPTGNLAGVDGIVVDPGKTTFYLVTAALTEDGAKNYALSTEGENPYSLTLGKDKTPVTVTLQSDRVPYDGTAKHAALNVASGGALTANHFTLTYYAKGDLSTPLAGAPVDAGEYVVAISFSDAGTAETWYLTASELPFIVEKVKFDVSGLQWKYDDAAAYKEALSYDAAEHTVYLDGKDGVDGLTIAYAAGSERVGTFAKTYTVTLEFAYNATNYDAPDFPAEFRWEIKKAVLDLSGVVWNYTEPHRYGWENGAAKLYEVKLLNLPAYMETVVKYGGTNRSSEVGSYNATFTVEGFDAANYEAYVFPANLTADLNWKIEARRLTRPGATAEFPYDGRPHNLLTLLSMSPEDLNVYYSVAATRDGEAVAGFDPLKVTDAGVYALSFSLFKETFGDNVTWDNNSISDKGGVVTVAPIGITLRGWNRDYEPPIALFDNAGDADYVEYVIRDEGGTVVDKVDMRGNTLYSVEAVVKAEFGANVVMTVADGAAASVTFTTESDDPLNPAEKLAKPKFDKPSAEYTGSAIAFQVLGLNEKYLELTADSDALTQTAVNVYRVTVRFQAGANARWEDDNTKNPVTLSFEITKKMLAKPSGTLDTDFDGGIRTFTPDGYDKDWMTIAGNAETNAGDYRATVTLRDRINTAWADGGADPVVLDWKISKPVFEKPTLAATEITFTGSEIAIGIDGFDKTHMTVSGDKATAAGNYTASVALKDAVNTAWADGSAGKVDLVWRVAVLRLSKPTLTAGAEPEYTGAEITRGLDGFDEAFMTIAGNKGTNAGNYVARITLKDKSNTEWVGGGTADAVLPWSIATLKILKPTFPAGEPVYSGEAVTRVPENYDGAKMTVSGNAATDAGNYTATFALKDRVNTEWVGGGTDDAVLPWSIAKLKLDPPAIRSGQAPAYTGEPIVLALDGAVSARMNVSGNTATDAGSYKVKISLKDKKNTEWTGGGTEDLMLPWTIGKAKLEVSWDTSGAAPKLALDGLPENAVEYVYYDEAGDAVAPDALLAGKNYSVRAKLKEEFAKNYGFEIGDAIEVETGKHAFTPGETEFPGGPILPIPEGFPLWQVIVAAAALFCGILFLARAVNNGRKTKKLKKKISERNFAVAGLPYLGAAKAWLGLNADLWIAVAGAAGLFCVVCFLAMLITGRKKSAAAEGFERAKREAVEEKAKADRLREEQEAKKERERREEEERLRREADMKVMFMMMNGGRAPSPDKDERTENGQPIFTYTATGQPMFTSAPQVNVEDVVTRVVAALMPAMQALPAAGGSSGGNEVLGNLIEKQMEMLERQSRIIENLKNERMRQCADEYDDEDDEKEEWSDDEEDDFYESDDDGTEEAAADALPPVPPENRVRLPANFRVRLKATSDKNRDAYVAVKNRLKSLKGVSFRMSGRIEKVSYHGEPIAFIGVARKSLKLWLALDPNGCDRSRYHQRDESQKAKYARTPMLVRIGSDRALARAGELIAELAKKFGLVGKRKNADAGLQELAYTLKYNALLKEKKQGLLRSSIHVHDADALSGETAERYLELRERARFGKENYATVSLDVLEANFYDGQKVTLEKLKAKGLVSEEYNGYRLTAGERLSKPLYVVADEYSAAAVKMIVLTGGRAVRLVDPFAPKFS